MLGFIEKIERLLLVLKKEYDSIIKLYEKNEIYHKSLPIRVTNKCSNEQKTEINTFINSIFSQYLKRSQI